MRMWTIISIVILLLTTLLLQDSDAAPGRRGKNKKKDKLKPIVENEPGLHPTCISK